MKNEGNGHTPNRMEINMHKNIKSSIIFNCKRLKITKIPQQSRMI